MFSTVYDHLSNLVAIPSVSGNQLAADQIIMYSAAKLEAAGMFVTTFNSNGLPSLVATSQPDTMWPKVMLVAHLDVVPGDSKLFSVEERDDRLYGRGVLDMKGAAAAFISAAETLVGAMADYDFGIMFTTDEEIGGADGVAYLLEQGYGADICLLPDGANNWRVEAAAKGVLLYTAVAHGQSAHGSRPWAGDSAADKLLNFLHEARLFIAEPNEHTDTTLVVSTMQAGEVRNQVPAYASAQLDVRFFGMNTAAKIEERLQTAATAHGVELTADIYGSPVEIDVSLPAVQTWLQIVETVRGQPSGEYALSFAASDARFFAAKGIPTIVTYPEGHDHHSDHEWISKKALPQLQECTVAYIQAMAGLN